jgi:beta-galactosidase
VAPVGYLPRCKTVCLPKTYIHDFYVVTDLDDNYRDATLVVEADIKNAGSTATACILEIDVLDGQNQSILNGGIKSFQFKIDGSTQQKATISSMVENPKKWSAEYPNLYTLVLDLKDENGRTLEAFTHRLGFREVEIVDNILKINGVPMKLNGVNSHMHHPEHGQAVPLETLWEDLLIMKRNSTSTASAPAIILPHRNTLKWPMNWDVHSG